MAVSGIDLGKYKLGWHDSTDDYVYAPKKGLNETVVRDISGQKDEPEWMTKFRLNALKRFERKPMLEWFATNMPDIDFDDIYYYLKPTEGQVSEWDTLPESMQRTYEKLGIPEAERKYLAGRHRAVRIRGRVPQEPRGPREAGDPLHRAWTSRCASTPSSCASTSARSSRRATTSSPR